MKTLTLVRHAKSSHTFGISSDFDRPLNDRGFREGVEMGKKLFMQQVPVDLFVSSGALRARTTAELFADAYDRKKKDILIIPSLYNAYPDVFYSVVSGLDDKFQHAALFSHNPGITEFASSLTGTNIDHMPTCSVFAVTADIDSWKDFPKAEKKFSFFQKPE